MPVTFRNYNPKPFFTDDYNEKANDVKPYDYS